MNSPIEVAMGEIAISNNDTMFVTFVGSCVALCLFDPSTKMGGMAHIMLPESNKNFQNAVQIGKYADKAIEALLKNMTTKGANKKRIKAKMTGGAQIFSSESGDGLFNIGTRNIDMVKTLLEKNKIPLIAEEVGMNYGRWVKFHTKTGELIVKGKKSGEIKL
ncbi:MAG: chemotaxis protein CheD [Thaumarchaeota archaeon]|nr:chemotaxis protein CheD [Nitrososphaerota archaeon]MBI3641139.1 chemotaxis protein CheD [Nitrososphaerota archaeon]